MNSFYQNGRTERKSNSFMLCGQTLSFRTRPFSVCTHARFCCCCFVLFLQYDQFRPCSHAALRINQVVKWCSVIFIFIALLNACAQQKLSHIFGICSVGFLFVAIQYTLKAVLCVIRYQCSQKSTHIFMLIFELIVCCRIVWSFCGHKAHTLMLNANILYDNIS